MGLVGSPRISLYRVRGESASRLIGSSLAGFSFQSGVRRFVLPDSFSPISAVMSLVSIHPLSLTERKPVTRNRRSFMGMCWFLKNFVPARRRRTIVRTIPSAVNTIVAVDHKRAVLSPVIPMLVKLTGAVLRPLTRRARQHRSPRRRPSLS